MSDRTKGRWRDCRMDEISRRLLARSGLSREAIDAALSLAGLRPARAEWREFALRAMRLGGILSLAAGMIFLVAFNWDNLGMYARFGMVEVPLLAALAVAWIKGVERLPGKLALMGSAYRVPNILAQLRIASVLVVSLDQRCTLVSVIRHQLL